VIYSGQQALPVQEVSSRDNLHLIVCHPFRTKAISDSIVTGLFEGNGLDHREFSDCEGDSNGFKLGITDNPPANHTVKNSIAFSNAQKGFIDNDNPISLTFTRNKTWDNGDTGFVMRSPSSTVASNIAAANSGSAYTSLVSTVRSSGNSWDWSTTWSNTSSKSVSPTILEGARDTDGSVQGTDFVIPRWGAPIGVTTKESIQDPACRER
jgi:hypothetical protein